MQTQFHCQVVLVPADAAPEEEHQALLDKLALISKEGWQLTGRTLDQRSTIWTKPKINKLWRVQNRGISSKSTLSGYAEVLAVAATEEGACAKAFNELGAFDDDEVVAIEVDLDAVTTQSLLATPR